MTEILQKSANWSPAARHQQLIQSGILAPEGFDRHFSVKGYTVADNLAPYVSHYWVMRWDVPAGEAYHPTEVLSQPVVHVFFTAQEAFAHGIMHGTFDYEARGVGVIAGITFKPGGFYCFLGDRMDTLTGIKTPLQTVFSQGLPLQLTQDDNGIVKDMEALLHSKPPHPDTHIAFIQEVVAAIVSDINLVTVEMVAKRFQTSERTLQHLFKTYVGVGMKWVIMRVRLLEAVKRAYAMGRPDWAAIAADLDYSSQAHFTNDFKRVVGLSPAQFMKQVTVHSQ